MTNEELKAILDQHPNGAKVTSTNVNITCASYDRETNTINLITYE